jgi:PadR family transcriptional regulator PadR
VFLLLSKRKRVMLPVGTQKVETMRRRAEIQQGTLALMVLKTLYVLEPQHGFGIARRVEQISGEQLALNQGTLYPLPVRLEQEGAIGSQWGPSGNNWRARFYQLTRVGPKKLQAELASWHQTADIIARFLAINVEAPL